MSAESSTTENIVDQMSKEDENENQNQDWGSDNGEPNEDEQNDDVPNDDEPKEDESKDSEGLHKAKLKNFKRARPPYFQLMMNILLLPQMARMVFWQLKTQLLELLFKSNKMVMMIHLMLFGLMLFPINIMDLSKIFFQKSDSIVRIMVFVSLKNLIQLT